MIKIAVASGKGGTGKTMLAGNLAVFLSKQFKVLLTDLDVEEPNSSFFVKGNESLVTEAFKSIPQWKQETCVLCGKCAENCNFHAVIRLGPNISVFNQLCHSCFACSELCPTDSLPMGKHKIGEIRHVENINSILIEGKLQIGEEQAVPLIRQTRQYAVNYFSNAEIQIYDCPPGNSCPVVAAVEEADYVLLVTEPTPFGLNDLKIAVETMENLGKRIGVVINRDGTGNNEVEKFCTNKQIEVVGKILYDRRIAESYARGELVFNKIGHLNQSVQNIAENLIKKFSHV